MASKYPKVIWKEEGMREGMQIENAYIPVEDKIRLIDAISETGIKNILIGSFVSPKWTPQMARIDEIVTKFTPKPGVTYTALALNERGVERSRAYSPPLTIERDAFPRLSCHMCDVFIRRNTNRSQMDEMARWPQVVARAQESGAKAAGIGANVTWGSNFTGRTTLESYMTMMEKQHKLWDEAGIPVKSISMGDPMSWCHPQWVAETILAVKDRFPDIHDFRIHLHNGRGMALPSMYAALESLTSEDTVTLDGTIGGFGGCPYCGIGRTTGMAPTEDAIHMFEDMGVETGIDVDKVIEVSWMLEEAVGRPLLGFVSKAGRRGRSVSELIDINAPFVETIQQARHFKLGKAAYEGGLSPYTKEITSPYYDRLKAGLPAYGGPSEDFPWKQDWFPVKN